MRGGVRIGKTKTIMKKYFLILLSMTTTFVNAQNILGTWNGALSIQGTQLRIVFHIQEGEKGLSTKMDSPDQGAFGIATDETSWENGTLTIKAKALGMTFEGKPVAGKEQLTGTFKQGGMALPLELSRESGGKAEEKPKPRHQDPQDFPYEQEEVKFEVEQGGHTMAGTLTYPSDKNFDQVVILISGSGAQNRNEELVPMNHRPFLVLSDHLTRNGIAVLRYDDRGVGESGGKFSGATTQDFAHDAAAAVSYLSSRKDMKGKKIGLLGHSEGGMIAPMVASEHETVDFIGLLAGPGMEGSKLLLQQIDLISESEGLSAELREEDQKTLKKVFAEIAQNPDLSTDELKKRLLQIFNEAYENMSASLQQEIPNKDQMYQGQSAMLSSTWFRFFLKHKPQDYLEKVSCPVLAINGSLDLQVPAKVNLDGIKQSLEKSGNDAVVIAELPKLNHLFQTAKTGAPTEYGQIEETFNPEALALISDWVLTQK